MRLRHAPRVVEEVEQIAWRPGSEVDVDQEVECCLPALASLACLVDKEANLLVRRPG